MTKTMVTGFEILLDCNNEVPELKKEDTTWVPSDWVDHTDPDAMATLLRDPICNIEEEEYWEACQHTLKSLYELRASDGNEEGGTALSDDEDEVKTRVIVVVTTVAMMVDMMMTTTAPIVMTTVVEVMIAHTVEMIGVNSLVIEKMKMWTYSMRNMTMMWTIMMKT